MARRQTRKNFLSNGKRKTKKGKTGKRKHLSLGVKFQHGKVQNGGGMLDMTYKLSNANKFIQKHR